MKTTDTHIYFWSGPFSNWDEAEFEYEGHTFQNSEQAFMWEKANFFRDEEIADKILHAPDPRVNKELGREVKNFNKQKWDEASLVLMVKVCKAKFSQSRIHNTALKESGKRILVEASPTDNIWGVGLHENDDLILDKKNWKGKNWLGIALMEVRNILFNDDGSAILRYMT